MLLHLLPLFSLLLSFSALSAQKTASEICPLKVGETIPELSLLDDKQDAFSMSDLISDKPAVIVFYRGAWCGYCMKHLAELNDAKTEIENLGYQIFGITVDRASKLEESYKKSEAEINVYSDPTAAAVQAFGLDWNVNDQLFSKYKEEYKLDLESWSGEEHHILPVPAIFIIKNGIVQFQYVNPDHSTRLKVETLLAILQSI